MRHGRTFLVGGLLAVSSFASNLPAGIVVGWYVSAPVAAAAETKPHQTSLLIRYKMKTPTPIVILQGSEDIGNKVYHSSSTLRTPTNVLQITVTERALPGQPLPPDIVVSFDAHFVAISSTSAPGDERLSNILAALKADVRKELQVLARKPPHYSTIPFLTAFTATLDPGHLQRALRGIKETISHAARGEQPKFLALIADTGGKSGCTISTMTDPPAVGPFCAAEVADCTSCAGDGDSCHEFLPCPGEPDPLPIPNPEPELDKCMDEAISGWIDCDEACSQRCLRGGEPLPRPFGSPDCLGPCRANCAQVWQPRVTACYHKRARWSFNVK